ncbi:MULTISPECIES: hypothetical protein [Enterobacterales]|jgi:hypothetical protein|uniref:Uncharacterized protein n=11 Tax=Enterobacterales TaxID=91347 RepID=A0A7G3L4K8_KLEPN|nr:MULTISPECIES: hypothetical protein [Enterobacterales]EBV7063922.1 hypothetical protein [Salmonella enterica subsp. enterica serovar Ohio]ECM4990724.1 hypothetical protein [Salmonella enterica subsp. enterica serovar Montevideo]EDV0839768.1 hypothetical protein [Salmonella enterica subsp. enterica serovar Havana]EEA8077351.1 hypothetical protein [Salmonella enterica subsp. enterica serovar Orion]EGZ4372079.1 hypothetical protein [Salmonella enterica subsp. enterica serovar Cerro]EJI0024297.
MIKMVSVVPQPETVKMLRGKMGMTETALGAVMGYELRAWQRKEAISDDLSQYNKTSLRPGEYNMLMLIAGVHPDYRLNRTFSPDDMVKEPATAEDVRRLRLALGLKHAEIAALFGYKPASWQTKEKAAQRGVKLKTGEFNFLLLLAGEHPSLQLVEKVKQDQLPT